MNEFFFVIQAQKIERNLISKHVVYKGFHKFNCIGKWYIFLLPKYKEGKNVL